MKDIQLSVIIPVYNAESYLIECLDSVYNQGFESLEVICINDGSTDQSLSVLENYKKNKHSDLIIFSKPNGGLATSRNVGYHLANGEYIYYLDNDDYLLPGSLKKMLTIVDENQLDILCFNSQIGENSFYFDKRIEIEAETGKEYFVKYYKTNSHFPPKTIWMHLYRKDLFDRNKLLFKDGLDIEDEHFSPRAFYLAKKVKGVNEPVVFHRVQRPNSIMHEYFTSIKPKYIQDILITCSDLFDFYKEQKNEEQTLLLNIFINYLSIARKITTQDKTFKLKFFNERHFQLMKICAISWDWYVYYWLFRYSTPLFSWYEDPSKPIYIKKIINRIFRTYYFVVNYLREKV